MACPLSIPKHSLNLTSTLVCSQNQSFLHTHFLFRPYHFPCNVTIRLGPSRICGVSARNTSMAPWPSFFFTQAIPGVSKGQELLNLLLRRGMVRHFLQKEVVNREKGLQFRFLDYNNVVLDGYSAPLTAGNFAKLVIDTLMDQNLAAPTKLFSLTDKNTGYSVPLEIMPSGQFEPLYRTTLSVQDGELPVLPLFVYGAVAMAHSEVSVDYSSPNQFFFYLYDKRNSGLGGISIDEGQFSVFGYTTTGREILPQMKTRDVIRSAKLVEGQDRLVLPDKI